MAHGSAFGGVGCIVQSDSEYLVRVPSSLTKNFIEARSMTISYLIECQRCISSRCNIDHSHSPSMEHVAKGTALVGGNALASNKPRRA